MTPERLAEIERLEQAASPGPWEHDEFDVRRVNDSGTGDCLLFADRISDTGAKRWRENAAFVADARTAVPDLLAYVRELEARLRNSDGGQFPVASAKRAARALAPSEQEAGNEE